MSAKRAISRKRSAANSGAPPESRPFYLDRNFRRHLIADSFRQVGHAVEVHDDHLPIDTPDEDWIALVAREGWIGLTRNKNIRYRQAELDAVRRFGARSILRAKNATGQEMADWFVRYAQRIQRFSKANFAPFVVGIDRRGVLSPYDLYTPNTGAARTQSPLTHTRFTQAISTIASGKALRIRFTCVAARASDPSRPCAVKMPVSARSVSSRISSDQRTRKSSASANERSVFRPRALTSEQASTRAVKRFANTLQMNSESDFANSESDSARAEATCRL